MTIVAEARLQPQRTLSARPVDRLSAATKGLLLIAAAAYLVTYIVIACLRMGYPYELEWMEGGSVDHVHRVLAGEAIYASPSLDFVAYIYTPLYWYVCAAVSLVTGAGFLPLRLVSFTASLGCLWILYRFVRRETGSITWAIVATGLYAATYRASGAWFDIARVDSLAMLFLLAAAYQVRFALRPGGLVLAGVLTALAFLTKQTTLLVALPLSVYCLVCKDRWSRVAFAATWIGLVSGTTWLLNTTTDGWYGYYVFELPGEHHFLDAAWLGFWFVDIGMYMGLALAIAAWYLYALASRFQWRRLPFYAALAVGMIGCAWLSRVHRGGYDNVLQPAYAFLAIAFALGAHALQRRWRTQQRRNVRASGQGTLRAWWQSARPAALCVVGLAQFAMLFYWPGKQVPSSADRQAGDAFVAMLKEFDGNVFVPDTGFLPSLAGHQTCAQTMAVRDVLQGPECIAQDRLLAEMRDAIRTQRFDAIILQDTYWFMKELSRNYRREGSIFSEGEEFWPVTGQHSRPSLLYTPKDRQMPCPPLPLRITHSTGTRLP